MQPPARSTVLDATRMAIQSAVAAAAMFLLTRWLDMPEVFVGVLSAVLIVQPSLGSTLGSGMQRIMATLVGCGVGVVTILIVPYGYGTAVSLVVTMLVMNAIAGFRSEWRYGVVAAVALSLGSEQDVMQAALDRSISITLGAGIGVLASLVVWPEKASTRAKRNERKAIDVLCEAIEMTTDENVDSSTHSKWQSNYRDVLREIDLLIENVRISDDDHLERRRDAIEDLAQAIAVFGRCAQSDRVTRDVGDRGDKGRDAGGIARAFGDRLSERVAEAHEKGEPLRRAIGEVADGLSEEIERWRGEVECQDISSEDAMCFALLEMHASTERLAGSYDRDAGESKESAGNGSDQRPS